MAANGAADATVSYEELIQLEYEFNDAEDELVRKQYEIESPLYKKRAGLVSKIPNFWALVLEQAPPDIDQYVQPSDSQVFAECLKNIEVDRFDIENTPRSFSIKFTFSPNEWIEDEVLEKKFYFRRGLDSQLGLVSEPVKVNWKKDKDLTQGLTDAAIKLWEAKQKHAKVANGSGKNTTLPEEKEILELLDNTDSASRFFTLFGFISETRYISAEESEKAWAQEKERRAKAKAGEEVEDEDDEMASFDETEICPHGAEIGLMIAEDIWPNAIKYFTQAQEVDDEDLSEIDFEDASDESDDEIDIRALVKGKSSKRKEKDSELESPPAPKKRS